MKRLGLLLPLAAILILAGCAAATNRNAPNETREAASLASGQSRTLPLTDPPEPQASLPFSPIKPIFTVLPIFPW